MPSTQRRYVTQAGVTMLELAIVLLIITLIASSVVLGRSMIRQSEIRASVAQIDKTIKAIGLFKKKYNQLPGDFNDAEAYWGADSTCPGTVYNQSKKVATCNGDGNGTIGNCCYTNSYEWYRAWQHLANAGMIEGQYTGVSSYVNASQLPDFSIPKSSYPGGGYTLLFSYNAALTAENFAYDAMHVIEFGAVASTCASGTVPADCLTRGGLMTPEEALEIDNKLDDGRPGAGFITGRPVTSTLNPNCTTSASAAISNYDITVTNKVCALIFNTGH